MVISALIVDYNHELFESSIDEWKKYGIKVERVDNILQAINEVYRKEYNLVVLVENAAMRCDILERLPVLSNLTAAPIVIATYDIIDSDYRIEAHNRGAIDVWKMPETIQEAVVKGWAIIRQYTKKDNKFDMPTIIMVGHVTMLIDYHLVLVKGIPIDLHKIEFNILKLLMSYPDRVFTHEQIIDSAWGDDCVDSSKNSLWIQMKRLREKLHIDDETSNLIQNKRGIGYSFNP